MSVMIELYILGTRVCDRAMIGLSNEAYSTEHANRGVEKPSYCINKRTAQPYAPGLQPIRST